jgi:hypothetical protein
MYVNCVLNLVFSIEQLSIDQSRDYSLNQAVNQAEDIAQSSNQPAKWLNRLIDGRTGDSSWRESLHGERFFVERVFVEIEASWRDSRHGEKVFVERKSSWRDFSVERSVPRREQPRRERLRGETLSVEKPLQGEMIFKEIMSLWKDSSRRDSLLVDWHSQEHFSPWRLALPGAFLS